jgi:hypothetical protein
MTNLQQAMKATDAAESAEFTRDHVSAVAFNAVLETLYATQGRHRLTATDFRRADLIRRVLLDTPPANINDLASADVANGGDVPMTPILEAVDRAVEEAVAAQQAAQ